MPETGGLVEIVNFSSKPRKLTVGEQIKSAANSLSLNTVLSGIAAVGVVVTIVATLSGWLAGNDTNAHELRHVQDTLTEVQKQSAVEFEKLNAKLDGKLGPDALADTTRRLSEISGQLNDLDHRQRQDEERGVKLQTEIESIERASNVQLPGRR